MNSVGCAMVIAALLYVGRSVVASHYDEEEELGGEGGSRGIGLVFDVSANLSQSLTDQGLVGAARVGSHASLDRQIE